MHRCATAGGHRPDYELPPRQCSKRFDLRRRSQRKEHAMLGIRRSLLTLQEASDPYVDSGEEGCQNW
ncbi:hypothetical protein KRP22_000493 [Phytophthora ramorum]|nr:hypothetical protein KRP22_12439 [Phytophthora ramorum]